VVGQLGSFIGDSFEDVIHERVHDAHSLAGNTSIWMNLLQHLVNVDSISFLPSLTALLLVASSFGYCFLRALRWSFYYVLSCHSDYLILLLFQVVLLALLLISFAEKELSL